MLKSVATLGAIALLSPSLALTSTMGDELDPNSLLNHAPEFGETLPPEQSQNDSLTIGPHSISGTTDPELTLTYASGGDLRITLPDIGDGYQLQQSNSSAVHFEDPSTKSSLLVQGNSSGDLRVITTIPSLNSEHEFQYTVDNTFTVSEDGEGGVLIYRFSDNVSNPEEEQVELISVAPPWAVDANGNEVPTHYQVSENTITQVVEKSNEIVYPVTADPTWEWYDFAYGAGWNKRETRELAQYGSASALCAFLPRGFAEFCGLGAASWIINTNRAVTRGGCVFYAVAPVPVGLNYDKSKNCR